MINTFGNNIDNYKLYVDIDKSTLDKIIATIRLLGDDSYILNNSDNNVYEIRNGLKYLISPKVILFDDDRTIHFIDEEMFVVKYKDLEKRNTDESLHKKNNVDFFDYQSPIVIGKTDIGRYYYLILKTRKKPEGTTGEKTYRGIIINPGLNNQ